MRQWSVELELQHLAVSAARKRRSRRPKPKPKPWPPAELALPSPAELERLSRPRAEKIQLELPIMRLGILLLVCVTAVAGCGPAGHEEDAEPPYRPVSSAHIPVELRQANYGPSCTHASAITMLRWQGQYKAAAWWRRNGYGPAYIVSTVSEKCRQLGLEYRCERNGNAAFLEWVSRTRRAAVVQYQSCHAVTFAGFRNGNAIIIDNRWPREEIRVPKQHFLNSWRAYGGHAITVLDLPPPPKPWR